VVEIQINIDCADLDRMTAFYEAALGYTGHGAAGEQYASMVAADGTGPKLVFQKVPEPKTAKNRVHLDLIVDDIEAEAKRFVALGAERGQLFEEYGLRWIVMRDPEGNEVCLCDG
jgi:predicted enzyme related to lactoylglutathione lyase